MPRTCPPLLAALLLLASAAGADEPGAITAANDAKSAASASNRFALDLYRALPKDGQNRFFSPYSISEALAMTRAGAAGETAQELDRVFYFPKRRAAAQAALRKGLAPPKLNRHDGTSAPAYRLQVANALWGHTSSTFVPAFLEELKGRYAAPLERLDFTRSSEARKRINDWVAEKTQDKIKDIVPAGKPTPDTRLALANAIYFKARWAKAFSESKTRDAPFHLEGAKSAPAKFMNRTEAYAYGEDAQVQVLELPYEGGAASMVVILPKRKGGLAAVEQSLDAKSLSRWLELDSRQVAVSLPRFRYTVPLNLSKILPAMGMPRAFTPKADFSSMCSSERLYIGPVLHKAFVAVDEKGTEAAAATVVLMKRESVSAPAKAVTFRADHPFLFLIRHRVTGAILFMGRVRDPNAN